MALALLVPAPSIGVLAAMMIWPGTIGTVVFAACKAWMLGLPLVWHVLVDRQRLSLSPARRGGFGVGLLLGVLISAVILLVYQALGPQWIDEDEVRAIAQRNGIGTLTKYFAGAAYWILINSVLEEYVYRWFVYRQCEALMPARWAVLASAAAFTVHHVIAIGIQFDWRVTALASTGVFVGGAVWSWLYRRYDSIWPAYLSHAVVDIAVFYLGWRIIFLGG
jgi:membrane protease YdiL (CAAX protease family)